MLTIAYFKKIVEKVTLSVLMDDWRSKKKLGDLKKTHQEDVNHDKWSQLQINGKEYENSLETTLCCLSMGRIKVLTDNF